MHKRFLILFFPCLFLTGCGIKGPLYLPPDPNDSYLSRIGKEINEMTGQLMVGQPPTPVEERQQPISTEETQAPKDTAAASSAEAKTSQAEGARETDDSKGEPIEFRSVGPADKTASKTSP